MTVTYETPAAPVQAPVDPSRRVLSQKQKLAWRALHDPRISEVCYGGAKGGAKTWLGCLWLYSECRRMIEEWHIPPQQYPIPVAWFGRQVAVHCVDTTLESWKHVIRPDQYELRSGDREIIIGKALQIKYGGLDDQLSIQKAQGAEYALIWIDQAEEVTLDAVAALRASRRRTVLEHKPDYKTLFTCNPGPCWLKDQFVDPAPPNTVFDPPEPSSESGVCRGRIFIPALMTDNPYLPPGYMDTVREAYRHRPEMLEALVNGRWDVFGGLRNIIHADWVQEALGRHRPSVQPIRRLLAVDVARFGDDETVLYGLHGTTIRTRTVYGQQDTMFTANRALVEARRINAEIIVVDATGIGAGVADRLVEMGADVLAVETGASSCDPTRFVNLRAEIWDWAAQQFQGKQVCWDATDEELARQLTWPEYEYRPGGRLLVQDKPKIKALHGRSPDFADAYVLGLAGLAWLEGTAFKAGNVLRFRPAERSEAAVPLRLSTYEGRRAAWEKQQRTGAVGRW